MMLLALACTPATDSGTTGVGHDFLTPPTLVEADPRAPLTGLLRAELTAPGQLVVTLREVGQPEIEIAFAAVAAFHEVPIALLRADRSTEIEVVPHFEDGTVGKPAVLSHTTPPLPGEAPDVAISLHVTEARSDGFTLIGAGRAGTFPGAEMLLLIDAFGEIVWMRTFDEDVMDAVPTGDGEFFGLRTGTVARWDLAGREVAAWTSADRGSLGTAVVADQDLHDSVALLDDGTAVALSTKHVDVPSLPTSYDDPGIRAGGIVADDILVAFDMSGVTVGEWSVLDALTPYRIGYDSLFVRDDGTYDWGRANAVDVHDADGGWLVSVRHQDAVVEIDPVTRAANWILAPPENWPDDLDALRLQPLDPSFEWPYHPHGARWADSGQLLVFDNGNRRASPWTGEASVPDEDNASRVLVLDVNEAAGTFSVVTSWDAPPQGSLFSQRGGSVELLADGHHVSTWGSVSWLGGISSVDAGYGKDAVIVNEVDENGTVVWQMVLFEPAEEFVAGWSANRSVRVVNPYGSLATLTVR